MVEMQKAWVLGLLVMVWLFGAIYGNFTACSYTVVLQLFYCEQHFFKICPKLHR